ncbi:hypothetical protein [Phytohabitans rumicis]|uniref:hypothetical protein n=1 Tax=Phytohabitans rumicis TaxID=1076125 RepID=UPI0031E53034
MTDLSPAATEPPWKLAQRLENLPIVLAGPIVRHATDTEVTVWLALRQRQRVRLVVYRNRDGSGDPIAEGTRTTVAVGAHLHIVAVTARVSGDDEMTAGVSYRYDVRLGDGAGQGLTDPGIVSCDEDDEVRRQVLGFGDETLPSFALPPGDLSRLRIVHGSCRKLHGKFNDGLATVGYLIDKARAESTAEDPWSLIRPHLLLLTGDQIYADDVADSVLAMCTDFGDTLLGWPVPGEWLPGVPLPNWPTALPPGTRTDLALDAAGFTGGLKHPELAKSHLMGLGEFLAMYLLAWSPTLWPDELPVSEGGDWWERQWVQQLRQTLPRVRRALANVVTYMILDDHEVTDDWNLSRDWCRRVWGEEEHESTPKPLARRIVTNALLAYALCQAWGNTPDRFTAAGAAGTQILTEVEGSPGAPDRPGWNGQPYRQPVLDRIADLLGVPTGRLPAARRGASVLPKHTSALRYDYSVTWPGRPFELIVTDPRTARMFDPDPQAAPGVLSDDALVAQLPAPAAAPYLTIVVIPGPVLGVPVAERLQRKLTSELNNYYLDDEAWALRPKTYHRLLGRLAHRPRVLMLSGDVHMGFTIKAGLWARQPYGEPAPVATPLRSDIAQLTASSFRHPAGHTFALTATGWRALPLRELFQENLEDAACWPAKLTPEVDWAFHPAGIGNSWQDSFKQEPAWLDVTAGRQRPRVFVPEHWRVRLRYITGWRHSPAVISPVRRPPEGATAGAVIGWVGDVLGVAVTAAERLVGTEVVGFNNVGEIRLASGDGTAYGALRVTHHLWWDISDTGRPTQCTIAPVVLNPTDYSDIPAQVWEPKP